MSISGNGIAKKKDKPASCFLKSFFAFLITFIFMFCSWIVLSGKFDPLLLWLGGISSFLVAYFFYDLLFPVIDQGYFKVFFSFIKYTPWLIKEIIKANFHLLYLAFHPKMEELIDPHIINFKTNLQSDIAITTLANSITLTPGTITITADKDGMFSVHAIDKESAQGLPGSMLEKVASVYGEKI